MEAPNHLLQQSLLSPFPQCDYSGWDWAQFIDRVYSWKAISACWGFHVVQPSRGLLVWRENLGSSNWGTPLAVTPALQGAGQEDSWGSPQVPALQSDGKLAYILNVGMHSVCFVSALKTRRQLGSEPWCVVEGLSLPTKRKVPVKALPLKLLLPLMSMEASFSKGATLQEWGGDFNWGCGWGRGCPPQFRS